MGVACLVVRFVVLPHRDPGYWKEPLAGRLVVAGIVLLVVGTSWYSFITRKGLSIEEMVKEERGRSEHHAHSRDYRLPDEPWKLR